MNDFKIGDKVRIIAAEDTEHYKNGDILTVSDISYGHEERHVIVICADGKQELAYLREIEPYTPDVITINRADLPEVSERDGKFRAGSGPEECVASGSVNPNWLRNHANSALALAEFLETREKYAREANAAEHKRNKRRDELARELARKAGWTRHATAEYEILMPETQEAIDMIIGLEASHD